MRKGLLINTTNKEKRKRINKYEFYDVFKNLMYSILIHKVLMGFIVVAVVM